MLDFKKKVIKMKTINMYKKLILMVLAVCFLASCVQDDDFDTPNTSISEPELEGDVVSISTVLGVAAQNEGELYTYEDTDDYVEGYVISSDEGGNFFREIIIQDAPENPTAGLKIALFVNPLFTKYEVGRKIYVSLEGFTVGTSNGVVTLGIPDGQYIDPAPAQFESKIVRSAEVAEIVPLEVNINDFSDDLENIFVQLNNVQFLRADVENNLSFAGEATDEFDGERTIESCETGASTIFSTSTFADFSSLELPNGSGSIAGVLSRTYEGDVFVIAVNTLEDVTMEGERCDPLVYDCGLASVQGTNNLISEDFESSSNGTYSGAGWTNFIEAGSQSWQVFNDSDNEPSMGKGVMIDSYQSGDSSSIAWLILPEVDFDAQEGETLNFKSSNSFSDGSNLQLLFSNDWDGDTSTINSATWGELSAATIVNDDDFYRDVIDSGNVDLSCLEGTGYIAFKYTGSGQSPQDGTYELDEISVDY